MKNVITEKPFQSSSKDTTQQTAFHIETSHLFCKAKEMAGFCMKCKVLFKTISGQCFRLCPLRKSENLWWFSDVFSGYGEATLI